jgi:hypothetical protein
MEDEFIENEISIDEIGYIAKIIDSNMTSLERMKIKKETIKKMFYAFFIYTFIMILLVLFL